MMKGFGAVEESAHTTVRGIVAVAEELGVSAAQVALAWLRYRPVSVIPIIGARKLTQIEDNIRSLDVELSPEQLQRLDKASAVSLGFPHDFIGSRMLSELIDAGQRVLGMTRSDRSARQLEHAGAEVHRGTLEGVESITSGAAQAEPVIHTAFDHDFSRFAENCEKDRRVINAIGAVLAGSDRPFIITSGTGMGSPGPGHVAIEDVFDRDNPNPRRLSEVAGEEVAKRGVSVAVVRLPQIHDAKKQGLVSPAIKIARAKGFAGYIGDGANRWPVAHVTDVARLYRLALDKHQASARWHAVAEEGVPAREVAEAIGLGLGVPVKSLSPDEAMKYFGWLGPFAQMDMPASSAFTRERLGWEPQGPGLIQELRNMDYSSVEAQ
ncbi:MAG TPA: aldo/keto reductase [Chthoniobacterales bacterium]